MLFKPFSGKEMNIKTLEIDFKENALLINKVPFKFENADGTPKELSPYSFGIVKGVGHNHLILFKDDGVCGYCHIICESTYEYVEFWACKKLSPEEELSMVKFPTVKPINPVESKVVLFSQIKVLEEEI